MLLRSNLMWEKLYNTRYRIYYLILSSSDKVVQIINLLKIKSSNPYNKSGHSLLSHGYPNNMTLALCGYPISELTRTGLGFEHPEWLFSKLSFRMHWSGI